MGLTIWVKSRSLAAYFMKHRCKQEEIILADERDFEVGMVAFFELERGVMLVYFKTKRSIA